MAYVIYLSISLFFAWFFSVPVLPCQPILTEVYGGMVGIQHFYSGLARLKVRGEAQRRADPGQDVSMAPAISRDP